MSIANARQYMDIDQIGKPQFVFRLPGQKDNLLEVFMMKVTRLKDL